MPVYHGPRSIWGVGFWAQQPLFPGPQADTIHIIRPIWRSLPDQLPPPLLQQSTFPNFPLLHPPIPVGDQFFELPPRPPLGLFQTWLQSTTALTFPPPPDTTHILRPIWRSLPDQPAQPLLQTWFQGFNINLFGAIQRPTSQLDWPNPTQPFRLDQTWFWSYNKNLIGKDQLPVGEQVYALVPSQVTPEQIQLHSWTFNYNLNLIGRDRLPTGKDVFDLAPGQLPPPPENLRRWEWKYNQNLIGKDQLPTGQITWELTPRDPREVRAWTWNYNLNLIGQDRFPPGEITYELAPRAPQQPAQSWTASYNLSLIGQDQLPFRQSDWPLPTPPPRVLDWIWSVNLNLATVVVKPFAQYDWQLTPAAPQPERTITASYNKNLIAQDQLPIRQQDWPVPIPPALVKDWIQSVNLALTTVVQIPFKQTDWPLTPAAVQPERSITASYLKTLIGQDRLPTGEQFSELEPRDPREVRSWTAWYNLTLIGQDRLPFRQQDWPTPRDYERSIQLRTWIDTVKVLLEELEVPFKQTDWPNPTPFARDPTLTSWAASYNRNLIGKDQLPTGQQAYDLAPRDAQRAIQINTWIQSVNLALTTVVAKLPFNQFDWPLPTPFARDPTLTSWASSYNRNLIGKDKFPFRQTDWPNPNRGPEQPDRSSVFSDFLFQPPFVPPIVAGAQYFLLQPHYLNNVLVPAWSIITEGIDMPFGWVPTLMVDPLNTQAVQAFYNAGPRTGYPGPGYDWQGYAQGLTSQRQASIQSPATHWQQIPGTNMYQLTGLGTGLPPVGI